MAVSYLEPGPSVYFDEVTEDFENSASEKSSSAKHTKSLADSNNVTSHNMDVPPIKRRSILPQRFREPPSFVQDRNFIARRAQHAATAFAPSPTRGRPATRTTASEPRTPQPAAAGRSWRPAIIRMLSKKANEQRNSGSARKFKNSSGDLQHTSAPYPPVPCNDFPMPYPTSSGRPIVVGCGLPKNIQVRSHTICLSVIAEDKQALEEKTSRKRDHFVEHRH